jgi:hypothetical protein
MKVAIVAKAATSAFAPYNDPEWQIWGLPWIIYRRVPDLYFDVHSEECWRGSISEKHEQDEWIARLSETKTPIVCHPTRCHRFDNAVPYPYEEIEQLAAIPLFENSVAYQIFYAIHKGVEEIGLYGVHMMGEREYLWERASVLYALGHAIGRGIKITVPPGSPLLMSYWTAGRYGETAQKRFNLT